MSLRERFQKAVADMKAGNNAGNREDLIEVYSLYKQASTGDVNTPRPDEAYIKGKTMWDGWNSKKGLTKDQAMEQYIAKVASLCRTQY